MQEITLPESIVKQEFYRTTEKFHAIACWIGIVLNIAWFASDYFVLPEYWIPFLIFRFSVSTISLVALVARNFLKISIYTCIFILVLGISVQNAYMWSVMDVPHLQKHAFAFIALFIGVGMLILWEMRLSLILVAATLISNIIFYKINSKLTIDEFLINGGLLTLTVAIFCIFLIRTRYRLTINEIRSRLQLAKSKDAIQEQKNTLEEKNKEITDSINYAKSIQKALIPSEEKFNSHFKDSFVLLKPKDIVSGDFYWIYETDNIVFYATADCTGHGVPGGFMTMLGLSFLNDIIEVKNIRNPAEVLNLLRDKIVTALKQSGNIGENKDGMDICLCCINKQTKELTYAAAHNDLYIIRNNDLHEYKADKQPCGFYHENKSFTAHTIQLEEGDCIYTFTDGFADQFGGYNGKKFRYKQFEELLLKNASLPFGEQKHILKTTIDTWRGALEQVDDILVIGVKI